MTIMAIDNSQWETNPLPCASNILNPDKLSFADALRSRIDSITRSNRVIRLRSLVLLATEDALEMNLFLQEALTTFNAQDFTWETVSDDLANKLRQVLSAYADIYQRVDDLKRMNWLLSRLTGLHRYTTITQHNTGMISEILRLLEEDREDVLAAHAALDAKHPTRPLADIIQELGLAA